MKLKKYLILLIIPLLITSCKEKEGILEVTVDYEQKVKWASDQYAVWIEDLSGNYINTLFVTQYATTGQAYNERPDCVPLWMSKTNPAGMTSEQIDAISAATPNSGVHTYTWNLIDKEGSKIRPGTYVFVLEATLDGDSRVLFKNEIHIGKKSATSVGIPEYTRPEREKHKDMIRSVVANYKIL
ncbi:DUF2271 domain-containing protein [Bacteroides sp. 51]|uniref:DUF2271 domain-containing protein n=1 Tax=Bacteroides sp. 51 TaxID=2302938 RepID=UPI0013D0F0AE|nr:DUF2271 domain-containing protein [Bacteroides sp. 51]NDV82561.1 DUF2271 domain-containing protein [Bacteroides sp. 51]